MAKGLTEQEKDCRYINERTLKTYRTKKAAMAEARKGDWIASQYNDNRWQK